MSHKVNDELLKFARQALAGITKNAFIPADPSGGGAPGGDPSGGGAAPPGGGGGAAPPMGDPGAGAPPATGGGMDPGAIAQQVMQMLQSQGGGMGGGGMGGGMVEPIKPKIDVNVELMQIKKMLAKLCDALNVHIPAADMAVNSQDLTQMAMGQSGQPAGGGGAGPSSSIAPIQPMQAAAPGMGKTSADLPQTSRFINNGKPFDGSQSTFDTAGLSQTSSKAAALLRLRRRT